MNQSKTQIFLDDISNRGFIYFFVSRIKKHSFTRKLWYLLRKPYVLIEGKKLFINKMDTVVSETLLSTGAWEPLVSKYFRFCVKKAGTIVDVGGNIGYFTLLAALIKPPDSQVFVFEPDTNNFSLLQKTVLVNLLDSVVTEKMAVGEKSGTLQLYQAKDNFGDHRTFDSGDDRSHTTVKMVSLDEYFLSSKKQIDVLKIDIQGYEVKALRGAKQLMKLRKIKVIFSELWPKGLQLAGDSWQAYIHLLQSNGFKLWELDEEAGKLVPFSHESIETRLKMEDVFGTNLLAVLAK